VRLVRAVDENWYEGHCGGRRGIFPASYVETLVAPDCSVMTPMTSRSVTPMPGHLRFVELTTVTMWKSSCIIDGRTKDENVR